MKRWQKTLQSVQQQESAPLMNATKGDQVGDRVNTGSPSESAASRTPSTSSLTEAPPTSPRARTPSGAFHPRTSRKASLALSFDERCSNASALPNEGTISNNMACSDSSKDDHVSSQKKNQSEEDSEEPQVQDSAYSWVVSFGAALQFMLIGGIHKSFGLVLAALAQQYHFSSAEVAVIPALFYAMSFLAAPACGALCRRFSERLVCFGGGILTLLGLALSALTSNIYALYVTNGLIFGVGQGFANLPGTLMVTK